MNIYAVLGGKIPQTIGEWCVNKANELVGVDDYGRKTANHTTKPFGFLASSFLKPFGSIVKAMGYNEYGDTGSIPAAVVCGFAAVAAGIVTGIVAAPATGVLGAIALGIATPIVSYPLIHVGFIATVAGSIGFLNAAFVGNVGGLVIAAKSALAARQPQAAQVAPAPVTAPRAATVATPAVDSKTVLDYIAQLPKVQQDTMLRSIKEKFPALVERTLEADWKEQQTKLAEPRLLTAPDVTFRGRAQSSATTA